MTKIRFLILIVFISLCLAWGGAYLAVVSQNPGKQPNEPGTLYGPISP
jgi:hypothetical protein